jgi:hypothetical protein
VWVPPIIDQFHVTAAIMVQRSIGVKKRKRRHCICKHDDAVYSSWQLCTYRHGRKEVFVNLLVGKIIYDYMYPVDLENNEKSCEYSAIQYMAKSIATCKKKSLYIQPKPYFFKKKL